MKRRHISAKFSSPQSPSFGIYGTSILQSNVQQDKNNAVVGNLQTLSLSNRNNKCQWNPRRPNIQSRNFAHDQRNITCKRDIDNKKVATLKSTEGAINIFFIKPRFLIHNRQTDYCPNCKTPANVCWSSVPPWFPPNKLSVSEPSRERQHNKGLSLENCWDKTNDIHNISSGDDSLSLHKKEDVSQPHEGHTGWTSRQDVSEKTESEVKGDIFPYPDILPPDLEAIGLKKLCQMYNNKWIQKSKCESEDNIGQYFTRLLKMQKLQKITIQKEISKSRQTYVNSTSTIKCKNKHRQSSHSKNILKIEAQGWQMVNICKCKLHQEFTNKCPCIQCCNKETALESVFDRSSSTINFEEDAGCSKPQSIVLQSGNVFFGDS